MIMNEFLSQVEKNMIQLRKRNMNILNEFKIEMFQGRKNIEKNIIKLEFGISSSQLINEQETVQNTSVVQRNYGKNIIDKDMSTNYNSRALESKSNDNYHISRFTNNLNKQNEDPNRRLYTDISVIEQFPVKTCTQNSHEEIYGDFHLNALKNDESIEINTEQVKKKYQKFISPSAGWTMSADPLKQRPQNKNLHRQITPFSEDFNFSHQNQTLDEQENTSFRKDYDMFGFKEIDERPFSRTNTIQELECEYNNESQNS